jgi:hypothetical protein
MYFTVLRAQITDVFVCNQMNGHCIRREPGSGLLPRANQETYHPACQPSDRRTIWIIAYNYHLDRHAFQRWPHVYFTVANEEDAVMNGLRHSSNPRPSRIRALLAVAVFSVVALCGTGLAAFSGVLPGSEGVACKVTAIPLVDLQVAASKAGHHHSPRSGRKAVAAT